MERQIAVVGSYADGGDGLIAYRVAPPDGSLTELDAVAAPKTAFVARHPDEPYVYAGRRAGGGIVSAFRVDPETGALTRLNERPSGGAAPGYVSVDATGQCCFVANCDGNTVAALPIESDGRLGDATDVVDHPPDGDDAENATAAHPHAVVPGPDNRFVYVPDLRRDRVYVYRIDADRCEIGPAAIDPIAVPDGSGPRHLVFGPDGRVAYLINEFAASVTVFERDEESGALSAVQTVETLPDDYEGDNKCADVHVHPAGEWVYGSNRGHDSIAVFAVEDGSGRLRPVDCESTRGEWPRDFELDRSGRYLFAENMHSDRVVAFEVDSDDGTLEPTGSGVEVAEPISMTTLAFE